MESLSNFQFEIINELVDDSLQKAVSSMSNMLNIRLQKNYVNFGLGPLKGIDEINQLGRFKVHVIKVPFNGEIGGAFYFIINAHEVGTINRACLPESVTSVWSAANKEMKIDFILEIENIMAAMSIAEISELLGVQILGEVPKALILRGEEVNAYLKEENLNHKTAFYCRSVLSGLDLDIAPYFLWMMDQTFVDKLKENIVEPD